MHIYSSSFSLSFNRLSSLVAVSLCSVLFHHTLFLLPQRTDFVFATAALHFLVQPSSLLIAFAVGAPSSPFALNSSIDLLFALTADAFCLRRIFAELPRDRRSLFRLCLLVYPLPNLAILLDSAFLLLYNYLAFACDTVFFAFFRLCIEARRDRLADNRLRRRSPNTTK